MARRRYRRNPPTKIPWVLVGGAVALGVIAYLATRSSTTAGTVATAYTNGPSPKVTTAAPAMRTTNVSPSVDPAAMAQAVARQAAEAAAQQAAQFAQQQAAQAAQAAQDFARQQAGKLGVKLPF